MEQERHRERAHQPAACSRLIELLAPRSKGEASKVVWLFFLLSSVAVIGTLTLPTAGETLSRALQETTEMSVTQDGAPGNGEKVFLSGGSLFQEEGCPYAISQSQAEAALADVGRRGNSISLLDHGNGRTGNHFMTISAYLAMGYCCRSKLLTLPGTDEVLPSENGGEFSTENRWFSFSDVTLPWPQYNGLGDNPVKCRPHTEDGGDAAFIFTGVDNEVLKCMNQVYLRGCESAYLGNLVDTEAMCPKRDPNETSGAGSLVMHIRSGDIFEFEEAGHPNLARYGQPPLQFYLHVLGSKPWDDVVILTAAKQQHLINPTFTALEVMANSGALGPNVRALKNRGLLDDVKDMLCADGLATGRSSLNFLTFAHTKATSFYLPSLCGPGFIRRMKHLPVKPTFDNATLLSLERPSAEVFGIQWLDSYKEYSVFRLWENTPEQRLEMVLYEGIDKLNRC